MLSTIFPGEKEHVPLAVFLPLFSNSGQEDRWYQQQEIRFEADKKLFI